MYMYIVRVASVRQDSWIIHLFWSITHISHPCEQSKILALSPVRGKNKAVGLADQNEILIGHLYNLIQIRSNFGWAMTENCSENGWWPAVILTSAGRDLLP